MNFPHRNFIQTEIKRYYEITHRRKNPGQSAGRIFRDSTCDFARTKGIAGIVRNESDGSVYIEAEGDGSQLEALRDWLREGPSAADVKEVDLNEGKLQNYDSFNVQT